MKMMKAMNFIGQKYAAKEINYTSMIFVKDPLGEQRLNKMIRRSITSVQVVV